MNRWERPGREGKVEPAGAGKGKRFGENKTEGGAREKVAPEGGGENTPRKGRGLEWNGGGPGDGVDPLSS